MKPIISILLPSIRPHKLLDHYRSIQKSTEKEFELIIVSPFSLPEELKNLPNIKYYQDWGNPVRAQCIGAGLAEGKYITWSADDCLYFPSILDIVIDNLEKSNDHKKVITCKYIEGVGSGMEKDEYYLLNLAYPFSPFINNNWWIFNAAIINRSYYDYLGGFDCRFFTTCYGHSDLAIRAYNDGANVELINEFLVKCEHMPGTSGDHFPIDFFGNNNDRPLYQNIYGDINCLKRTKIKLDNWKDSENIWSARFDKYRNKL